MAAGHALDLFGEDCLVGSIDDFLSVHAVQLVVALDRRRLDRVRAFREVRQPSHSQFHRFEVLIVRLFNLLRLSGPVAVRNVTRAGWFRALLPAQRLLLRALEAAAGECDHGIGSLLSKILRQSRFPGFP